MAGSVPKIIRGNITVEKGLADHPVYFCMVAGSKLVVKGEAKGDDGYDRSDQDTSTSIKWGSKLMKNVNNRMVNTKVMDKAETDEFLRVARMKFRPLPTPPGVAGPPMQESKQYINVSPQGSARYTWVKMPVVNGLSDADFTKKVNGFTTPVKGKVKEQIVRFTDETLWPSLGKVLAVDIFNGNSDRFDISTGRWINYGNVMFVEQNTKVIGLDTFDPNTKQSNLASHGRYDELLTLTDPLRRKEFAENCARSVGETLEFDAFGKTGQYITLPVDGPDGRIFWKVNKGEVSELYLPYAQALAAGIQKGSDQLKQYLQQKVRQYKQRNSGPPQRPPPRPPGMGGPPQRPPPRPPGMGGPPQRPPPRPPVTRARAAGGPPPRPNPVILNTPPVEGIPQGILDRMHFLGWLD